MVSLLVLRAILLCVSASCQGVLAKPLGRPVLGENLSDPIVVSALDCDQAVAVRNRLFLQMPSHLGRRVRLRISPESWCKFSKNWNFYRMKQRQLILSCPNAEQAELALDAITAFVKTLNGKLLAGSPISVMESIEK